MKEFKLKEFNKKIDARRSNITRTILRDNQVGRIRTRKRDADEVTLLNTITKSRWQKAVELGKVKKVAHNVYTYYFD